MTPFTKGRTLARSLFLEGKRESVPPPSPPPPFHLTLFVLPFVTCRSSERGGDGGGGGESVFNMAWDRERGWEGNRGARFANIIPIHYFYFIAQTLILTKYLTRLSLVCMSVIPSPDSPRMHVGPHRGGGGDPSLLLRERKKAEERERGSFHPDLFCLLLRSAQYLACLACIVHNST